MINYYHCNISAVNCRRYVICRLPKNLTALKLYTICNTLLHIIKILSN